MENTKFDELEQYLDIAKLYGIKLTPKLFNHTVMIINKDNFADVTKPYMNMATKLFEDYKIEKSKCDSEECNCDKS